MLRLEAKVRLPISVTGTSIHRLSFPSRARSASLCSGSARQLGFTLWELVIVVAIIAITLSMMQFSIGLSDQTRDLKRVGSDLGKLIKLMKQEAVFENRNYAISVLDKSYVILVLDEGAWIPSGESFFKRFKMAESQVSELLIDEKSIDLTPKADPEPHILILASGEMTPFEWRIRDEYTQSGIVLQGNIVGGVLMTGPEPLE